jgi:uncharacterized damage-inducible protein DinB
MTFLLQPEFWLRGPVDGVPPLLQPVAHALLQANAELHVALNGFPESHLWEKPAGVASIGFHLQHVTGVLDRLFTYARKEQLNPEQLAYLNAEGKEKEGITLSLLLDNFMQQVEEGILQLKNTPENSLSDNRGVGRKQIPSNVIGLLFHAAEHIQRHTGQVLVTAKLLSHSEKGQ